MRYCIIIFLFVGILFGKQVDYQLFEFEDKNNLSLKKIHKASFVQIDNYYLNKGFSFHPTWLKLVVHNNTDKPQRKVFSFDNPTIDFIDFYENDKLKTLTGDNRKVNSRQMRDIGFAFLLELKANEKKSYYFKVKTNNTFSIRFTLENESDYFRAAEIKKVFLVFFSGFVFSITLYNLFLYLILKEQYYLIYVLFQWSVLIILWSLSGVGYYFIWIDKVWFNEFSIRIFDDLAIFMGIAFTKSFLNTKYYFPRFNRLLCLLLVLLFYVMITPWEWHAAIVKPVMIGSLISVLIIAIYAVYKEVPSSKLYFFGWFVLITAAMTTLLKNFGFVEINFFTTWGMFIGSMLEALIFSIALAKKIDMLKEEKRKALQVSKEKLNYEVEKKTFFLNEALKERELILKEIHHRVKNNLQIISAFITIASSKKHFSKNTLLSIQDRIRAISLLHEHLYKHKNMQYIEMKNYITQLVESIKIIYINKQKITFLYEVDEVQISFDKTIIVGLIINELVTNALKYAFHQTTEPRIQIVLVKEHNKIVLKIEDNGCGFSKDIDFNTVNTLGLKMVYRLTKKQLQGEFKTDFNNKTCFIITF